MPPPTTSRRRKCVGGRAPCPPGRGSSPSPPSPALVPVSRRLGLPAGPAGTGPSSRGDNPGFVPFVRRPARGRASLLHKGISWWGLVPLSPGWGQRWAVGPAGVWRCPPCLAEGVGDGRELGRGGWDGVRVRRLELAGRGAACPPARGPGPVGRSRAAPQVLSGSPGGGRGLPKLLPGTLPRSRCAHRPGKRCRLVACLEGTEAGDRGPCWRAS